MDIPGMGRVSGRRIGLETLGTSVVAQQVQHGWWVATQFEKRKSKL
jgi:hypothetical protein